MQRRGATSGSGGRASGIARFLDDLRQLKAHAVLLTVSIPSDHAANFCPS